MAPEIAHSQTLNTYDKANQAIAIPSGEILMKFNSDHIFPHMVTPSGDVKSFQMGFIPALFRLAKPTTLILEQKCITESFTSFIYCKIYECPFRHGPVLKIYGYGI